MKKLLKIGSSVAAFSTLVAATAPLMVAAWGPASRPTYTIENPASSVVFNSITNNPKYGDERNFAHIKESTESNSQYRNNIDLTPGKTYDVFVYYHNDASETYNSAEHNYVGIARGAFARVEFPSVINGREIGNVVLGAQNATPGEVWDSIYFNSVEQVTMRYVQGSAKLTNFAEPREGSPERTFNLTDELFSSTGTLIGYDAMDGNLPGCNFYSGYITFQLTVDNPDFTLQKQVRLEGETDWKENVNAKAGDIVEFQLTYRNTGNTNQMNVNISDKLPAGLTYIVGSTKIRDGARPNGASLPDGIVDGGLTIGNYAPNAAAYILFSARVDAKDEDLVCGENKITNIGKVTVDGGDSKEDDASVTVDKECTPPVEEKCDVPGKTHLPKGHPDCKVDVVTELPVTGPASLVSGIVGIGSLATAGTYFVRSRKKLN